MSAPKLPAPNSLAAWLLATRPATLGIAVAPVLVGSACARLAGRFAAGPALAALLGAVLILIGTNLANDVFDYEKGADTKERLGPTRVTQAGLLSPRAVRAGMWTAFALAALCGAYLTATAGPLVIAIGVASILSGIAYTGGPYPLGYNGLGDVFVFTFLGLIAVGGTEFVQTGSVHRLALLCAVPIGALATAVLVVNNVRDVETDRVAGKRTLAVRLGRGGGLLEYHLLTVAAYALPPGLVLTRALPPWALLPLLTLPLALRLNLALRRQTGAALNPLLKRTAQLLLLYGALWALGLWLCGGVPLDQG